MNGSHREMHVRNLTTLPGLDLEWQMTNCERFALTGLLERIRPDLSLEIGTYQGGSLQVLSRFSQRVLSLDIDPDVKKRLHGRFQNVDFRTGDSKSLLPEVIDELNSDHIAIEFILIDGDHSTDGVKRDIEAILQLKPRRSMVIIMHDSFNPACRAGMRTAAWAACPHVHSVELDFIPGIYHYEAYDTAETRSMWGGFACAVLEPELRRGDLVVGESQQGMFEAVFRDSVHAPRLQPHVSLARRALRKANRLIQKFR